MTRILTSPRRFCYPLFQYNSLAPHQRLCTVGASVGGEEVKAGAPSRGSVSEGLQVLAPHGRAEQLLLGGNDRSPLARQPGRAPKRLLAAYVCVYKVSLRYALCSVRDVARDPIAA